MPYPNLAAVPAAPAGITAGETAATAQRLVPVPAETPATQANSAALAGLSLPVGVPPLPNVPGLALPATPAPHVISRLPQPATPMVTPYSAPVSLAFQPGSAIVTPATEAALVRVAGSRGFAEILAGGFGDGDAAKNPRALTLAVERARAIADALTAAGTPPSAIRLTAAAAGSGGFVQLVY
jgi:outer membrane protein OmpA-like peptidoglycan-associated protein